MNRWAAGLYRLAPVWSQNAILSGFGVWLDRERYSGRYSEYQRLLLETERMSRTELEAYQDEQLRRVIAHAYATVPYYRRCFDQRRLTPKDIRGRSDLEKLPLLTKDDIRTHFQQLRSDATPARALRTGHTSGTTGTPLTVGYDRDVVWMTYAVFDRHYRWAGCRFGPDGDRIAVARGNVIVPLSQRRPPFWRYNRHHRQMLLSSFHLSQENLPRYFDALAAFSPSVIDGYPSTLYVLAKHLQNRGQTFPLKAAITSSETLFDFQRETIERSFACRVFDYYAMAERVIFASECSAHSDPHLAMEYGITEVVDSGGMPMAPGSTGRLVGTSLHNLGMPLIRYVTNDISAVLLTPCACGRQLEVMQGVATKAEDVLTLRDGRLISPSVLTHPFKPLDCIDGSQIVQTDPDTVTVRLIPRPTYTDAHTRHLVTALAERLGQDVRIDVQFVSELETSANGKFKWVISKVPLGV